MPKMIEIYDITYKYKGASEDSLQHVSLSVSEGETVLLCGASGSGKTSVIRLVNGLIPHFYPGDLSGTVRVAGNDTSEIELAELAGTVGTVFQNPQGQFFATDTDGEIVFGPENIGLPPGEIQQRKDQIVSGMKLQNLMDRSLFELSGGEKQKIACASVAALLPEIILLDEPSSNLDWNAIKDLREVIREWKKQGKTLLISEHRLWYIKDLADRVIYMDEGRIAHEWSGAEFRAFTPQDLEKLQLRPTTLDQGITRVEEKNAFPDAIHLKNFFFSYQRHQPDPDLSIPELDLPRGKIICVTGENGAGKSTFLRCVCGLEKRCKGTIEAEGKVYKGRQRLKLSYLVMQEVSHQLFTNSVEEECLLSMEDKDEEKCHEILEELDLLPYKDTHPMALSGGQKQRVAIASALAADAKIILLDEPTSGLDYTHMKAVSQLLQQLTADGKTILVSTHDPEFLSFCGDYELHIRAGTIAGFYQIKSHRE